MSNVQINPTTKRVIGYSNCPIKFKGETNLNVECNTHFSLLRNDCVIVSLLGRDLWSKLNMEIVLCSDEHWTHAVNQDVFAKQKLYLSHDFK